MRHIYRSVLHAFTILLIASSAFAQTASLEAVVDSIANMQQWVEDDCFMCYNRTQTLPGHSTLSGKVTDLQSGWPLPNAYVSLAADFLDSLGIGHTCCCYTGISDAQGNYAVHDIAPGYRTLTVSAAGYRTENGKITVNAGKELSADFALPPVADSVTTRFTGSLIGRVWSASRMGPFPGATVALLEGNQTVTTDQDGVFRMDSLSPGRHTLSITSPGYQSRQIMVQITAGSTNRGGDTVLKEKAGDTR